MKTNVRTIETDQDRAMLHRFLDERTLPITVEISDGKRRTPKSNRLQMQWCHDIAEQLGDTPEYWRGYCKLHYGVGIRKAGSVDFAEAYDRDIRPLPYELKLKLMMQPHDFPITRDFRAKEMKQYLDEIQRAFAERGVELTDPDPVMK